MEQKIKFLDRERNPEVFLKDQGYGAAQTGKLPFASGYQENGIAGDGLLLHVLSNYWLKTIPGGREFTYEEKRLWS